VTRCPELKSCVPLVVYSPQHYENMASKDKVRYQKEVSNASASAEPASESANDQDDDAEDDE